MFLIRFTVFFSVSPSFSAVIVPLWMILTPVLQGQDSDLAVKRF
jgi:hypothetical protein